MKNYNFEELSKELKNVKLTLQIFTALTFTVALMNLFKLINVNYLLVVFIYFIFISYFLRFIWFKMPIETIDKIGETVLILLFGIFALWMWIPDKKEIKALLIKYNSKLKQ